MINRIHARIAHLVALALIMIVASCLGACRPAEFPARETARGAIHGMSWGVQLATVECAVAVEMLPPGKPGDELHDLCDTSWDIAFEALLAAEYAADHWDTASAGKVACLAGRALAAFERIVDALDDIGATISEDNAAPIEDAMKLGKFLIGLATSGGQCAYK
jgi:hypothetical protein